MSEHAQQIVPAPVPVPAPLLRGWAHLVSFPVWMAGGLAMVALTNVHPSGRVLLAIYVVGTGTMFGVSALYHRVRWQPRAKALMQKFDRSAIFLAIAGGYTPIAFVCLDGWVRVAVLTAAWGGAAVGIAFHWMPHVSKVWRGSSYMIVSWSALFVLIDSQIGSTLSELSQEVPLNPDERAQVLTLSQRAVSRLQTWVVLQPRDALAWQTLARAHQLQNQPLRAVRAEAEARAAQLDYAGAADRFRAAQSLPVAQRNADPMELAIVDSRRREVESQLRESVRDEEESKR